MPKHLSALFLILALLVPHLEAWGEQLKVGVAGAEPFVIHGEPLDGLSVAIWKELAKLSELDYELKAYPNVAEVLAAVEAGELDVAIGPISITAQRAEQVDFTQPYYRSNLGLLGPVKKHNVIVALEPFFSFTFLYALGVLLLILAFVGTLVTLAERRANPEHFGKGLSGLGDGMWFAIVTMTTVGYGDKSPVTPLGRFFSAVWMLVATISFSTLTAGIATTFTLTNLQNTEITSPEMLKNRTVGVVAGSTGAQVASDFGASVIPKTNLHEAVSLLLENKVQAVVFDHPALKYYLQQNPTHGLRLAESHFQRQDYGFAMRRGGDHRVRINIALLKLQETGRLNDLEESWLAQVEESND